MRFLDDEITYNQFDFKLRFSTLNDHNKELFLNKQFQVCLYINLNYEIEVNIFRRVQNGVAMSKMELLRSFNPDLMNRIEDNIKEYNGVWNNYNIETKRDNKMNYIYRCLMIEYKNQFTTLATPELQKFIENYNDNYNKDIEDKFIINLKKTLEFLSVNIDVLHRNDKQLKVIEFIILYKLYKDIKDTPLFKKKFIKYFNTNTETNYNMLQYVPCKLNEEYNKVMQI